MDRSASERQSDPRRGLGRFFLTWLGTANLVWLATPWLEPLAPTWGPIWLWTTLIPALSLAALNPRRAVRLAVAAALLPFRAAALLTRPCRFRAARG